MAMMTGIPGVPGLRDNLMATPGGVSPAAQTALSAMTGLPSQGNAAIAKMQEVLHTSHQLIMSILPQLTNMKPDLGKGAHAAARMVLDLVGQLDKEGVVMPPPDMMMGMAPTVGMGPMGSPGGGVPGGGVSI